MADQGKWWKLWISSLDDDDLENLSVHEWFCWVRLGAHIKAHGKEGKIRFRSPGMRLVNLFRVTDFEAAIMLIRKLPNFALGERETIVSSETNTTVTYEVESLNWLKYQGDFSSDRVRRFRDKKRHDETVQEERRRRRDKTRGEETTPPIAPQGAGHSIAGWFEKTWQEYPKERRVGKKAAFRSYQKAVKDLDGARAVAVALDNYLASQTVKDGFIKNASTFFANWEDFKNDSGTSSTGVRGNAIERHGNSTDAGPGIQAPETHRQLQRLADSARFPGKSGPKSAAD